MTIQKIVNTFIKFQFDVNNSINQTIILTIIIRNFLLSEILNVVIVSTISYTKFIFAIQNG